MQAPVMVINTQNGERQVGRKAQISNITAAKTYGLLFYYVIGQGLIYCAESLISYGLAWAQKQC